MSTPTKPKTAEADVQDVILTSMLQKVDVAVDYISKTVRGENAAGNIVYDLKADGVGYNDRQPHR